MNGRFFTSAEAARTFGASAHHASKLIDAGELRGFKMPGSNFRRVAADDLKSFLLKHDVPLAEFELILASKIAREEQSTINKKLNR